MKIKRIAALLLALLLTVSSLFGCIGTSDNGKNTSSSNTDIGSSDSNAKPDSGDTSPDSNAKPDSGDTSPDSSVDEKPSTDKSDQIISLSEIPEFDGETPFVAINGNRPFFKKSEITSSSFEKYAALDSLGRCGVTIASIGIDIMPTEDRESITSIKPSGWINAKYDIVDGSYLYNRCHLIGFQLTGENANKENLITGTRFMNVEGMLPFENMVADYVKETKSHVMYRVTPIFEGSNLVASGVLMEAFSVEDDGKGIEFCVYVYNNQPGIIIDYRTGESRLQSSTPIPDSDEDDKNENVDTGEMIHYILNTNTKKFHLDSCGFADSIKPTNRKEETTTRNKLIDEGYSPCQSCKP